MCASSGNTAICLCPPQFGGSDCKGRTTVDSTKPNVFDPPIKCTNNTCLNGGTCQVIGQVLVCICGNNFTGVNCETQIPLCNRTNKNPCQNGGTCIGNGCLCAPGFSGEFCQNACKLYT